jgi:hypothetical protein
MHHAMHQAMQHAIRQELKAASERHGSDSAQDAPRSAVCDRSTAWKSLHLISAE